MPAWPVLALGLLLGWLVLVPLALLTVAAFKPTGLLHDPGFTLNNVAEIYGSGDFWHLVRATLVFGVGSSVFALLTGAALAWLVERTDLPLRNATRTLVILQMAMPPFLLAVGWIMMLSPRTGVVNHALVAMFGLEAPPFDIYTLSGMIFVEGLSLVPSAFLILAPAMRNMDPSLEEAAAMSGASNTQIAAKVTARLLAPALIGTGLYLFMVCLVVFDIPGTIGMPSRIFVISSHIYALANDNPRGLPEYGQIGAIAFFFVVMLVCTAFAYQHFMRSGSRFVTVTGKNFRPRRIPLGRWRPAVFIAVLAYFALTIVMPLAIIVWTSFMPWLQPPSLDALSTATWKNHADVFANPTIATAAAHSLIIALGASSAVALISVLCSYTIVRTRLPGRRLIDLLTFMPLAIPGILLATALIYVYLTFKFVPVYGTIGIIAIAYLTTYLSFGTRSANGVMVQVHAEIEEAARTSGASQAQTLRRVMLPIIWPSIGAIWFWVFAHCLRELTQALMLQGVDNATLPTVLYGYWSTGQPTKAAALGVWMMAIMLCVVIIWRLIERRSASRMGGE